MAKCKTVNVVADNDQGFMIINACDFDEKKYTLFDLDAIAAKEEAEAVQAEKKAKTAAKKAKKERAEATAAKKRATKGK